MEGITAALARITELQGTLSALHPTAPAGRFDALLRQAPAAPVAGPVPAATAPSAAWLSTQRPASLTPSRSAPAPAAASAVDAGRAAAAVAASYPNGQIPEAALTTLGDGERLRADAAAGFLQLRAAAARSGIELRVNDSYRSLAEQEDLARRKGLYAQGGLAAEPGTSTHGLGLSVDLQLDSRALAWVREHGERHGFVEDVPREPWHWTYRPGR